MKYIPFRGGKLEIVQYISKHSVKHICWINIWNAVP